VELFTTGVETVAKVGVKTALGLGVVAGEEESLAVGVRRLSIGGEVGLVVGTLAPVV